MLAYSSISHAGFMLIAIAANNAVGARALLYYLIPYSAMSIGAFAIVAARERELRREVTIDDMAGLGWERRSEEHTSELQSRQYLVCRLLLEKKKIIYL